MCDALKSNGPGYHLPRGTLDGALQVAQKVFHEEPLLALEALQPGCVLAVPGNLWRKRLLARAEPECMDMQSHG